MTVKARFCIDYNVIRVFVIEKLTYEISEALIDSGFSWQSNNCSFVSEIPIEFERKGNGILLRINNFEFAGSEIPKINPCLEDAIWLQSLWNKVY